MPGEVIIYVASPSNGELRQGEIISGLVQARQDISTIGTESPPRLNYVTHPYAIIVSQDCDLLQDYRARQGTVNHDKLLPNILFCEVTTAEEILNKPNGLPPNERKLFKQNRVDRYHFLRMVARESDALGAGLPDLGIDFKRYFSIPTEEVYKRLSIEAKRRCFMNTPYLEHLNNRFSYFQQRIALPEDHHSV